MYVRIINHDFSAYGCCHSCFYFREATEKKQSMANTQVIESKQETTENLNSAEKVVVAENETNEPLDNEINDNVNNINDNYISMNGDINNNEEHIEPPEIQVNGEENVEGNSKSYLILKS